MNYLVWFKCCEWAEPCGGRSWQDGSTIYDSPKAKSLELAMSIFGIQHWERPWSDILVLESRRGLGNFPLLQVTFTLICSIQMQLHFSLILQKLQSTVKAKLAPLKYTFLTLGWNIFHFSVGRTALPTGATEETLPFSWAADALPWADLPLLIPQHHSFGVIPAPQEKGRPAYFSGPEQYLFKKKTKTTV